MQLKVSSEKSSSKSVQEFENTIKELDDKKSISEEKINSCKEKEIYYKELNKIRTCQATISPIANLAFTSVIFTFIVSPSLAPLMKITNPSFLAIPSPFDATAVDFLESLDAPAYKIASPEVIDLPLIRKAASTGKPLIISTGMASYDETREAVEAARSAGDGGLVVLHCTAAYPAPAQEANLATIADLSRRLGALVGLSDHTLGTTVSAIAVALGAVVIEKHFTLDRSEGGVDSAFSLEPEELAQLVREAAIAHVAVGAQAYDPTPSEASVLKNRRSLYVVAPVKQGEAFTPANIRSIRPGAGLKPKFFDAVMGRTASRDLKFGEPLDASMIEGGFEP